MKFIIFALFGLFSLAQGCRVLRATPGVEASFNSHARYGYELYENDVSRCWILSTEADYVIKVWTENFRLEEEDRLYVYCGADGNEGVLGRFTGAAGIEDALFSSGSALYVNFETDARNGMDGFTFGYTAVEARDAPEGNCVDDDNDSAESHQLHRSDSDESHESHERHRSDSDESHERHGSDSDESHERHRSDSSESHERHRSDSDESDESWDSDESDESWESDEMDDVEDIVIGVVVMIFIVASVAGCVACFAISLRARQRWFVPSVSRNMASQGVYTSFNNPLAEKAKVNEVV